MAISSAIASSSPVKLGMAIAWLAHSTRRSRSTAISGIGELVREVDGGGYSGMAGFRRVRRPRQGHPPHTAARFRNHDRHRARLDRRDERAEWESERIRIGLGALVC